LYLFSIYLYQNTRDLKQDFKILIIYKFYSDIFLPLCFNSKPILIKILKIDALFTVVAKSQQFCKGYILQLYLFSIYLYQNTPTILLQFKANLNQNSQN
ncbi:hypothetical protein BpHYR1_052958, partial [Brachionus plicatilis]